MSVKKLYCRGYSITPKIIEPFWDLNPPDNIHSLERWMNENDFSIYQYVKCGVILISEKDTILDRASMLASGQQVGDK